VQTGGSNVSIFDSVKRFKMPFMRIKRLNLEFRSDFFNTFNLTQWNAVSLTYTFDPNTNILFGQVEDSRDGRIIQMALKLSF
jgi:hypothetical protein